jgi:hypothetical protein
MDGGTYTFDLSQFSPWHGTFAIDGELGLVLAVALTTVMVSGALFCAVKGKYGILLIGFLIPGLGTVLYAICGFRLAKPRSFWARHMYDRKAIAASIARFEPPIDLDRYPERKLRKGYEPSGQSDPTA